MLREKPKLFTIGQFAALHGINKKTLMWYDEIGLFKPAFIHEENGYRLYSYYQSTELEVILEDGLGTFTVPVTVWAGEEGRNLVLYGMCAYGGQTEAVSLLLEKTEGSGGGVTPSSAAAPVWRPVRYAPAEPLEE